MNYPVPIFYVELTPQSEGMIDRLKQVATYKIPLAMKRGMDAAIPDVIERIKSDRFSGKGPFPPSEHRLGEVTGLLKSSVTPVPSTMDVSETECTITGGIQVIGVPYAPVHEFGYSGDQTVRAHQRTLVKTRTKSLTTGRLLKRPVKTVTRHPVQSFTRHMNIPARAPFRTGMEENLPKISDSIKTELGHAVENI